MNILDIFNTNVTFTIKNEDAPKKEKKEPKPGGMVPMSFKLHPVLAKRIEEYADKEHRMFSETVRDLIVTGLRTRGEL